MNRRGVEWNLISYMMLGIGLLIVSLLVVFFVQQVQGFMRENFYKEYPFEEEKI